MKRIIYILSLLLVCFACQHEEVLVGETVLDVNLSRGLKPSVATRAVDADLALTILDEQGNVCKQYAAGTVPQRIVLFPGTFTLRAFTENEDTWAEANNGKGEGYYFAETQVVLEEDKTTYTTMNVPMQNYAVALSLPAQFDQMFNAYTFTLKSGIRTVSIKEGEKAYFAVAEGGFSYQLSATNTDNTTHTSSEVKYTQVLSGKLYTMTYSFADDAATGGVEIEITDDMDVTDEDVNL